MNGLPALLNGIEALRDDPPTPHSIAKRAALSPHHVPRLFSCRMVRRIVVHVRGRRLAGAAQRQGREADIRPVDPAFACGCESQEALTRARKRNFAIAPGRLRHGLAAAPWE